MHRHYPFSDKDLIYDYHKHQYVLTQTCVEEELGISLGTLNGAGLSNKAKRAEIFLNKTSDVIYRQIYNRVQCECYFEWLLATCPRYRDILKMAMLAQVEYFRNNGDIGLESGVNLKDGRAMEPVYLRGVMRISPDAYDILQNAGLFYSGSVAFPVGWRHREGY